MAVRILIVDNAPFARDRLKRMLEDHGYEVVAEAEDTHQAVSMFKKFNPDVVTLDLLLEGDHGFRTLAALQKIDSNVRVIVISAIADQATMDKAFTLGAKEFVTKAEDWSRLDAALSKVVKV